MKTGVACKNVKVSSKSGCLRLVRIIYFMRWEAVLIKINGLILIACIAMMTACGAEQMNELVYEKAYSVGSTYKLQFIGKIDKVTVSFDSKDETVTVRGLKYKYLIKFSDVESVSIVGNGDSGVFVIKTSRKINEIGTISKTDFDAFAKEVKTRSLNIRIE